MQRVLIQAFIMAGLAIPALAGEITTSTHISAVTVYGDRATVTREAEIEIPAGASTIVIENLPATLMANSLKAEGVATTAVTLGALESKIVNGTELAQPRERELNATLQGLQDKRALIEADSKANESRQTFLTSLGQQAAAAVNQNFVHMDLKPEEWSAASNALYIDMDEALKADVTQTVALREIDEQIAAVQGDLGALRTGQRNSERVAIPLETATATTLTMKLSYQVPNATWTPLYDARLDTAGSKLAITQFGQVRQSTGEDWTNVALTLSTAQPTQGATPPRPGSIWVNLYQPNVMAKKQMAYGKAQPVDSDAIQKGLDEANENSPLAAFSSAPVVPVLPSSPMPVPPPVPAAFRSASLNAGGYVTEYKIPGTATVTADNTARRVMIGAVDATGALIEQVVPALNTHAFLVVRTKIGGDAPLLPGTANLFRDGVYIGNSELPLVRPGDETTLGFGVDDQIVVKRQVLFDKNGTDGIISKNSTRERQTVTSIHNLHRFAVKAEVLEALPLSRNDQIKVDILPDATTDGYTKDAQDTTGLALWKLDLAADGKGEVKLGWRVSWPEGSQITGLQ